MSDHEDGGYRRAPTSLFVIPYLHHLPHRTSSQLFRFSFLRASVSPGFVCVSAGSVELCLSLKVRSLVYPASPKTLSILGPVADSERSALKSSKIGVSLLNSTGSPPRNSRQERATGREPRLIWSKCAVLPATHIPEFRPHLSPSGKGSLSCIFSSSHKRVLRTFLLSRI